MAIKRNFLTQTTHKIRITIKYQTVKMTSIENHHRAFDESMRPTADYLGGSGGGVPGENKTFDMDSDIYGSHLRPILIAYR